MGKIHIDPYIRHWWEESKKGPLPEKLDDAALEFEMALEAHEETQNGLTEPFYGASKADYRKRAV